VWEHYSSDWTGMMRSSGGVEIDRDTGVSAEASGGHDYIPTEEVGSCRELLVAQLRIEIGRDRPVDERQDLPAPFVDPQEPRGAREPDSFEVEEELMDER